MLKIAIVGCGKIADSHALEIQRIKGCEIVAVCDQEPLMAQQLAERFQVQRHFCDVSELISNPRLEVVHVTTPRSSQFEIPRLCLESRCEVLQDKQFTFYEN